MVFRAGQTERRFYQNPNIPDALGRQSTAAKSSVLFLLIQEVCQLCRGQCRNKNGTQVRQNMMVDQKNISGSRRRFDFSLCQIPRKKLRYRQAAVHGLG